jgi:hypothetical protein
MGLTEQCWQWRPVKRCGSAPGGGGYLHGGARGEVRTVDGEGISKKGNGGGKLPVQPWLGEETKGRELQPVGKMGTRRGSWSI